MKILCSIRISVIIIILQFFSSIVTANPIILNGGIHDVDNDVFADHHPAFIIDTNGPIPTTLNINAPSPLHPLGGRIFQHTTRDSAQGNGDPTHQPPFNTQNSAVVVTFPVGPAAFTMNLNNPVQTLASQGHNPNLDHYSPAISLAGNSTLNVSSIIIGDIQVAYNFAANNINNVIINLNGGVINGNIYTTQVVGINHSPAIGTVNINNAYITQGDMTGLSQINFNSPGTINVYHALKATHLTVHNNTVVYLNTGELAATELLVNNGTLCLQGGNLNSAISGTGLLNLLTNFTPRHHIRNQHIVVNAGNRFTLNPNIIVQSAADIELLGNSSLRINGGTLNANLTGSQTSTLEIEGPFVASAGRRLQAGNILVNSQGNGASLTTQSTTPIMGFNSFTIFQGGIANLSGNVTSNPGGIVTNHGQLILNRSRLNAESIQNEGRLHLQDSIVDTATALQNNSHLILTGDNTVNGNYIQSAGSVLSSNIVNAANFGKLNVQGNALVSPLSSIELHLAPNAVLHEDDVFPIISATSSQFADVNVITHGNVPFVFIKDNIENSLRLRVKRHDYLQVAAQSPFARAIVSALLAGATPGQQQDPMLKEVIRGLYNTPRDSIDQILHAFSPNVAREIFLNGLTPTRIAMQKSHHRLRLGRLNRQLLSVNDSQKLGYMAGDIARDFTNGRASIGPVFFGNGLHQKETQGLNAYRSGSEGFGLLGDVAITDCIQVGAGAMYAGSVVRTPQDSGKININSAEGIIYAGGDFGPAFLDGSIVAGHNWYRTRREISLGRRSFLVFAKHKGFQYSAKLIAGYDVPFCGFKITPLAGLEYDHLHQTSFLEKGLINRFTSAQNSHLGQASAGLRLSFVEECSRYVPEIHALYIRDLNDPKLQVTSQFTTGGPAFTLLNPPNQSRNAVNVGVSLTAMITENVLLSGSYDFEGKKKFQSHSGTVRVRFVF